MAPGPMDLFDHRFKRKFLEFSKKFCFQVNLIPGGHFFRFTLDFAGRDLK
jgi:hypothetical protein